jgi:hypothetical protein
MGTVPGVEVNVDTVYIRTNITRIETEDFTGWEYDEIQYGKNEYIEQLKGQQDATSSAVDFLLMNSI